MVRERYNLASCLDLLNFPVSKGSNELPYTHPLINGYIKERANSLTCINYNYFNKIHDFHRAGVLCRGVNIVNAQPMPQE